MRAKISHSNSFNFKIFQCNAHSTKCKVKLITSLCNVLPDCTLVLLVQNSYAKQCDLYCLILHQTDFFLQEMDNKATELHKIKKNHLEIWLLQTEAFISTYVVVTAIMMHSRFCGYFMACG